MSGRGKAIAGVLTAIAALATVPPGLVAVRDLFGDRDPVKVVLGVPPTGSVSASGAAVPNGASTPPELQYVVKFATVGDECGADWLVPESAVTGTVAMGDEAPVGSAVMSGSSIGVLVQATTNRTLVLNEVRARPFVGPDLRPAYRAPGPSCGGQVFKSYLKLDLDSPGQKARLAPNPTATERSVNDFPFTVSETDPILFSVELNTTTDLVAFTLELDYTWGGQSRTLAIDNGGQPFLAGSGNGLPLACFEPSQRLARAPAGQQWCL